MKLHKIAGISKHICTKEQLAAYRFSLKARQRLIAKRNSVSVADFRNIVYNEVDYIFDHEVVNLKSNLNTLAIYLSLAHGLYYYLTESQALINYDEIGILFYIHE